MKSSNKFTSKPEKDHDLENVLVLQGGGSLGAYECGAFKALDRHNIKFDIVSGTSIGAINATILQQVKTMTLQRILKVFGWL